MLNLQKQLPDRNDQVRLLKSITKLRTDRDFQLFVEFLEHAQREIDRESRKASAPNLQWNQGAAQLLDSLFALLTDSESNAMKIAEQLQRP